MDIKTGNIAYQLCSTGNNNQKEMKCVAWSSINENILASATDYKAYVWDVRKGSEPINFVIPSRCNSGHPHIEFIKGTSKLLILGPHFQLILWDIIELCYSNYQPENEFYINRRVRFSLAPYSDPPIAFLPYSSHIRMIDLNNMTVIRDLVGHVGPVSTTFFNPLKFELYSASSDGNIVWAPITFYPP